MIASIMTNYVTSAVLEEAPCVNASGIDYNSNYSLNYNVILKKDMVVKLKTDKGIFYAGYDRIPPSLLRELASMKAGDKIDIFFRIITLQLDFCKFKEQVKYFYDVKIHEGDIKRFKQCLWHEHEEIPVIARIDMVKAKYGLPLETKKTKKTKKMPRFKNWMKPKIITKDTITLNDIFSDDAPYLFIALFFAVLFGVGSFFVI